MICVDNSYNSSSTFCERSITCKSASCESFVNRSNHCYEVVGRDDECFVEKRENATKWENHTDGCMEYKCNNEIEFVSWKKCKNIDNSTYFCLNDECGADVNSSNEDWMVEVFIKDCVNPEELLTELSTFTGIDINDLQVQVEVTDDEGVKRVLLYLDNEERARNLADSLNVCASQ